MKQDKINLKYDGMDAYYSGVAIHPQLIMKSLGITYSMSVPQSIADQWFSYDCKNIPDVLPKYISILEDVE